MTIEIPLKINATKIGEKGVKFLKTVGWTLWVVAIIYLWYKYYITKNMVTLIITAGLTGSLIRELYQKYKKKK